VKNDLFDFFPGASSLPFCAIYLLSGYLLLLLEQSKQREKKERKMAQIASREKRRIIISLSKSTQLLLLLLFTITLAAAKSHLRQNAAAFQLGIKRTRLICLLFPRRHKKNRLLL